MVINNRPVSDNILRIISERGYKQSAVARKAGYSRQTFAVSGVGQEQAHFLTLPANRRVMGKNIKDDHVSGCRVETLQSHNVMAG